MNIKNNLINRKFSLRIIIYSAIYIITIRHFIVFNTIAYNDFKKRDSEILITTTPYIASPSNDLAYSTNLKLNNKKTHTLSRGYIGQLDKNLIKKTDSSTYEEGLYALNESAMIDSYLIKKANISTNSIIDNKAQVLNSHLPDYLMYKNVHITNLREFLKSRNSRLAEDSYLLTILSVCENFNLNPLILFAITGQEQSFVPNSNDNADKIANNPFNVFGSWIKYNTNIEDSATIAARTVVNLCKDKPDNVDAITWVNRKYCEDKNWSKAVRSIFKQLEANVSYWK